MPYSFSAAVYDQIYADKDYAAEARRLRTLIRSYGPAHPVTLLDVACGTGAHLAHLTRGFDCTGLDASPGMLRIARRKLPHVRFVRGRMESFDLGRRFDIVTCLFSAIGYVRSEVELRRTLRGFADHLRPGGVVIVEPWLTRKMYRVGHLHLRTFGSPSFPIARMDLAEERNGRSILRMHHLVGTPKGVRHWVELHDLGMFDRRVFLDAFRAAGLRPRYFRTGLMPARGLYVAVRPRSSESPVGRATP
ncbi:MAG: class I SAM-dependent DNA methyltransferase [Thermoplasmata archaeon]